MIITIFGATGTVGKHLVRQGLLAGHTVKAYGRNIHELIDDAERNSNLQIIKGGMFDKNDVVAAVKDSNVVLSALGGSIDGSDATRSLGIKYVVEAMEKHKVERIVAIGGLGCLQADEDTLIAESEDFPKQFLAVTEEHLKALQQLRMSSLAWTFVCPAAILDADVDGKYHTKVDYAPSMENINAGNLAQFMLTESERNNYVHYKVGIANNA
jgi:hypothetical protein